MVAELEYVPRNPKSLIQTCALAFVIQFVKPVYFVRLTMASIAELTQQVVMLTDQVQTLTDRLVVTEQNTSSLQTQGAMGRGSDSGVFDKKRLYPNELKDSKSFRS